MPNEQIAIGVIITLLCLMGVRKERWMLERTKKGERLVERFGPQRAIWVLRCSLFAGIVFGVLLATNVIRPVQW